MKTQDRIQSMLSEGVKDGVYPGAVLLVAQEGRVEFLREAGHRLLTPHTEPIHKDTIFDLASLTKPLATTLAIMKLVDQGDLHLDETLMALLPGPMPGEKRFLTPRLLLAHSAGFPDWKPLYLALDSIAPQKKKAVLRERLLNMPLAYTPGKETVYSDLGFMLLEWIVEVRAGVPMHLFLDQHFYGPLVLKRTFLCHKSLKNRFKEAEFAATEDCPWRKRTVIRDVHDENAYAVGGYSGHAGLFGTAKEVYTLVNVLRGHFFEERSDYLKPETVRKFFALQGLVAGSTWALGWDTPSPENSSSGKYFSKKSVGHLGFTGTSIWIDLERDVMVIFLTNRIHPTRNNEKIKAFRPRLHDLLMEELGII